MKEKEKKSYTVTEYIALLNAQLEKMSAEIIGEVSEMKVAASGHVYFTLKDAETGEALPCVMWKGKYAFSGVELEAGVEVQVKGTPSFTGRFGKLSFIADTIELVGEGALKKAYDKLKQKLTKEGFFTEERKRSIPEFPEKIGVITSAHGAVIHDFTNNLGKFGFKVKLMDSRVEGQESGRDLILSIRSFKKEDIDVLVLMRGGGSMQSLAGFDNEILVREIASFPVPVLAGIGHHQDIPLAALVADATESTPSLVAALLNRSWENANVTVERAQNNIFMSFKDILDMVSNKISLVFNSAKVTLEDIFEEYEDVKQRIKQNLIKVRYGIVASKKELIRCAKISLSVTEDRIANIKVDVLPSTTANITSSFSREIKNSFEQLKNLDRLVQTNNPERQLRLGYSLVRKEGRLVKSVSGVSVGEIIQVQLVDGDIQSQIKSIK